MEERICKTCLYYSKDNTCHFRPPIVVALDASVWTGFPHTSETDIACHEYYNAKYAIECMKRVENQPTSPSYENLRNNTRK